MPTYTNEYFDKRKAGVLSSAEIVVADVLRVVAPLRSVVDIGCGTGAWLAEFMRNGVREIVGLDGTYVSRASLEIPPDSFIPTNLETPIRLGRKFDLAISIEVAEHLSPERAGSFIEDLTNLASVVLFSAAIPGQGGTNHINEQWPKYWAEQFVRFGYKPCDCLRMRNWSDDRIKWWYRQNMMFFLDPRRCSIRPDDSPPPSLVHPGLYEGYRRELANKRLRPTLMRLTGAIAKATGRQLRGLCGTKCFQ